MAARTIDLDFSAVGASTALTAAGGAINGSGTQFVEGVGFFPGAAGRIWFQSYANAADFAGNWHMEIEVNPDAISIGYANNAAFHQSQAEEINVTSITRSGTVATVTVVAHDYATGNQIYIKGSSVSAWNALWTITGTTDTTLTFTCAGTEADDTTSAAKVMRNYNKQIFAAYPSAGTDTEHIMLYRQGNGTFSLLEKSGGVQVVTNCAVSSLGKGNTCRIDLDEVDGILYLRINGALLAKRTRTAQATSSSFQNMYIGGGSFTPNYMGQGFFKRFKLTNQSFFPSAQVGHKVVVFGDSFVSAGSSNNTGDIFGVGTSTTSYGVPLFDAAFVIQMQQQIYQRTGRVYTILGHGNNGHGWSDTSANPLSADVANMLTNDPTVVWCHGSVNDIQGASLNADYDQSWRDILDTILAHSTVRRVIVSTIPPCTNVANYDTLAIKENILEANTIIRSLREHDSRVWVFDHFAAVDGFNTDLEHFIGSAYGTTDEADLHWSPKGHAYAAKVRADLLIEALTGVRQTADRRFILGGASVRSSGLVSSLTSKQIVSR